MKVKSLLVAALAAISMSAIAGGTAETDKVYINNCEAKVGEQIELPIIFETQTGYGSMQFDVVLPEGLTAVKVSKKFIRLLDNERWCDHTISQSTPAANTYRAVIVDMANQPLDPGNDACATIAVTVDKEGELKGKIVKTHWSTGVASEGGKNDGDGPDTEFVVKATSTGVSDINAAGAVKTYKVIENGQIYIVAGDKKYNVMGAEVK
ncbi:MAG: hypothetical protein Q4E41_03435 [Bacteroidales bacterium]|nr:hypothetical protein [Bacteroidales bacterium]